MDSTMRKGDSKIDSTTLNQRKAFEYTLCEEIYKNLHMMMKVRQPTDDLKSVMNKEMFVKSNPKAFIHVMHFTLTFLDEKEFSKRFYWPIHDKKTENNFRTSMVEYLNVLNLKHSLGFETIKMHIVVMPGGTKFMRILHALVKLTMREYIKLKTKGAVQDTNEESVLAKINNTVSKMSQLKEEAFIQKRTIDEEIAFKRAKIAEAKIKISQIMSESSIECDPNDISAYLSAKCSELNKQIPELKRDMENTSKIISELERLSESVEAYIKEKNENVVKFNEEELKSSLEHLNASNVIVDKKIDFFKLITVLKELSSPIEAIIQKLSTEDFEHLKEEENDTKKLLQDCKKNKMQLTELENVLSDIKIDHKIDDFEGATPAFKNRLIETPPIRFSISCKNLVIKNPRLPLMDAKSNAIHSNTVLPFRLCEKNRSINRSIRNDKMDPMSVLKQITRTAKKQGNKSFINEQNLSALATKWKDREQMMYGNLTPTNISSSTIVSECEYEKREGIFKMNSPAQIFTEQIIETTKTTTPDSIIYSRSSRTNSVIRMNIIKSPLGKLPPLVGSIPRILMNDEVLAEEGMQVSKMNFGVIPDINFEDEESINNISDTILIDLVDDSP